MDENIKICSVCGRGFVPAHSNARLCSDECRAKSARLSAIRLNDARRERNRQKLGVRYCTICGEEFIPKNPQMIMCSKACYYKKHKKQKDAKRKKPKAEVKPKKIVTVKKKPDKNEKLIQKAVLASEAGMTYGKAELQNYLEKQSIEMAIRRRQMQAEWERRKQNDRSCV